MECEEIVIKIRNGSEFKLARSGLCPLLGVIRGDHVKKE